jgi:short-subunit dehydrogenase
MTALERQRHDQHHTGRDSRDRARHRGLERHRRRIRAVVRRIGIRQVALAGYEGLMKGKAIVIPGLVNWLGAQSPRVLPRSVVRFIVRGMQNPRQA